MAPTEAQGDAVSPPPEQDTGSTAAALDKARARGEKLAREREQLLADIAARLTDDLKRQVGYVLSLFPDARNSDTGLAIRVWQLFHSEELDGNSLPLEALYRLPKVTSITRARAKIQNEYRLFAPSPEVQAFRTARGDEVAEEMVADRPGPPMIAVHSDESGKSDRYLVAGSLWIMDVVREAGIFRRLLEWKSQKGIKREFKFAELTKANLTETIAFVETAMADADAMGFKACVVDRQQLKKWPVEEAVSRLYYELAVTGVEHEVRRGRVALPRMLSLVKDADDGPDALLMPELARRLATTCREHFGGQVTVDSLGSGDSKQSVFLQLADLFSGSVARILNKGEGAVANQKDEFAGFFEKLAGFPFASALDADRMTDFIYIHHLGWREAMGEVHRDV